MKTFSNEMSRLAHEDKTKASQFDRAKAFVMKTKEFNPHHVSTPIRKILEDPIVKAKKLMDDSANALKLYQSIGVDDDDAMVIEMKEQVKLQTVNYFKELKKQGLKNSLVLTQSSQSTQDSASTGYFDLTY
jgi:hypothetical protein